MNANTRRLAVLVGAVVVAMVLGCTSEGVELDPEDHEMPDDHGTPEDNGMPESVDSIFAVSGDGHSNADSGEVSEAGYCDVARHAHALAVARVDSIDPYEGPCEERPHRRPFSYVELRVLDAVAGPDLGEVFVTTKYYSGPLEVGDFVVAKVRIVDDHRFLHGVVPVVFGADELDAVDPPVGLDYVWSFPTTDYETFISDLAETWHNFETHCPEYGTQFPLDEWSDEEIHEYYFGDPICPSTEPEEPGEYEDDREPEEGENDGE